MTWGFAFGGIILLCNDEVIFPIHKAGKWHEQDMLEHIRKVNRKGLYIDVGACYGNHTLYFSLVMKRKVVAFEPDPENYKLLLRNIKINAITKVKYFNRAVSDSSKYVNSTRIKEGRSTQSKAVPDINGSIVAVRLDSLKLKNVGVIKIDVEGNEPDVLLSAKDTITQNKPDIYIEMVENVEQISEILTGYGYRNTGLNWGNFNYLWQYDNV